METSLEKTLNDKINIIQEKHNLLVNHFENYIAKIESELNTIKESIKEQVSRFKKRKYIELNSNSKSQEESIPPLTKESIINKLNQRKNKGLPWKQGMSKYKGITYQKHTKKWAIQSGAFKIKTMYFTNLNDVETYYKNMITKYNIPEHYIIRDGYPHDPFENDSVIEEN